MKKASAYQAAMGLMVGWRRAIWQHVDNSELRGDKSERGQADRPPTQTLPLWQRLPYQEVLRGQRKRDNSSLRHCHIQKLSQTVKGQGIHAFRARYRSGRTHPTLHIARIWSRSSIYQQNPLNRRPPFTLRKIEEILTSALHILFQGTTKRL